ncbi:MAG: BPL-N domain-containing protein [Thermodesulfovibrionales bacterium]|nr:BPL-N domain-containing protein [Thermodesulfovibrionales bacterium]
MAYKTLKALGLSFELIRSEDIRKGCLKNYRMLFVPGGWASNKLRSLGIEGIEEIRRFVLRGGNYFGICGGAGLATIEGVGLLNIERKPTKQRVPSFSGRIELNIENHYIWKGLDSNIDSKCRIQDSCDADPSRIFYAWWPSQFVVNDKDINVVATFGNALPDAFSSDLNVGDVMEKGSWEEFENFYGINLNPERLKGEPAVVEGRYGDGRVLLSLIHFDTPGDENGAVVLKNIWEYLGDTEHSRIEYNPTCFIHQESVQSSKNHYFQTLHDCSSSIIDFGLRNFLWFWRTPMLLQWRRGVRGLEYCTLYIMTKELTALTEQETLQQQDLLLKDFTLFKEKALLLLMLERTDMQKGMITYEHSDNPDIKTLRVELFGNSKSYGGKFKQILDKIDQILYKKLISAPERI